MGKAGSTLLKYKGVFDFDNLFETIYDWLLQHGYEVQEKVFKHKIPTPKGAEQEIEWVAWKLVTHYIKYYFTIEFKIMDLKEVEIVKDDQKLTKSFAKIRIRITAEVRDDWQKIWQGSKFIERLGWFFKSKLYFFDVAVLHEDKLAYRIYELQSAIKASLDMESKYNAFERRW